MFNKRDYSKLEAECNRRTSQILDDSDNLNVKIMGFEIPGKDDVVIPHCLHLMDNNPDSSIIARDDNNIELAILDPDVGDIELLKFVLGTKELKHHIYTSDAYYPIEVLRKYKNVVVNNPFDLITAVVMGVNFVVITRDRITINLANMIDPKLVDTSISEIYWVNSLISLMKYRRNNRMFIKKNVSEYVNSMKGYYDLKKFPKWDTIHLTREEIERLSKDSFWMLGVSGISVSSEDEPSIRKAIPKLPRIFLINKEIRVKSKIDGH